MEPPTAQRIRLPGLRRFEMRFVDGAANPYLAFAGSMATDLDGGAQKIDPGAMNR
jgi:glutamine synthetase